MDTLNQVIPRIQNKLKHHRDLYQKNEQMVRNQLIDPLLNAAGWNPDDPEKVQTNVKTELGFFLDYLLKKGSKNVLIIEAKNLGIDVNNKMHLGQILSYCYDASVRYCLITNGSMWILFEPNKESTKKNEKPERKLWTLNLEKDDKRTILLFFKILSPSRIEKIPSGIEQLKQDKRERERIQKRKQAALEKKQYALDESWNNLIKNQSGITDAIQPLYTQYLDKYRSRNSHYTQKEITAFLRDKLRGYLSVSPTRKSPAGRTTGKTDPAPGAKKIIINNSLVHRIEKHKQYEILIAGANWLIQKGKLKKSMCPIFIVDGITTLVNTKPVHADGTTFRGGHKLDNGLWIATAFNEATKIEYVKRLFEKCGLSRDLIRVE